MVPQESLSPLLRTLQKQIVPGVRQNGMENVVVAQSCWEKFHRIGDPLPDGVHVTRQILKSKPVPVKPKPRGRNASLSDALWPEDGLCSTIVPLLMFVVDGQVALPLGDYVVHCQTGHAVLMPAGTPHPVGSLLCPELAHLGNETCDMFTLMPWGEGVECWLNHTRGGEHWSHRTLGENCHVLHAQANFYLETLAEEAVARAPHYRLLCDGLLLALATTLLREIQEQRAFHPVLLEAVVTDSGMPSQLAEHNPIAQAQAYIRSHLHEPLSIDSVASHVYMSRTYFTRQFRKTTGKSFMEYITECRLEKAKVLLQDTQWPIEKVSSFVGVTPARLRLLFHQHLDLTPGDFRRRLRSASRK